jgi:uncharacterized protein
MKTFNVELVITEECNLGCKYCYMNNVKSSNMTKETFDKFLDTIDKVMKKYDCENYHVSFFGGEPLVNWNLLEYAIPKLSKDRNLTSQTLITNGLLLTDNIMEFLKKYNVGVSLSFDGLWNEFNRPLLNGESSLEQYKNKKEFFKKHNIKGCKVMISPESLPTLIENFEFLINEMHLFPDFTIVRDDIWSESDISLYKDKIKMLADKFIEYMNKDIYCTTGLFELYTIDTLNSKKYGKRSFGCFAGINGSGYAPNGLYYPCARFSTNNEFPIYDANTNSFFENNLNTLRNTDIVDPRTYYVCKSCSIYEYCNSGCTYSQLQIDDKNNVESIPIKSVCELLKISYEQSNRAYLELKDNKIYQNLISSKYNQNENKSIDNNEINRLYYNTSIALINIAKEIGQIDNEIYKDIISLSSKALSRVNLSNNKRKSIEANLDDETEREIVDIINKVTNL